MLSVIFRVGTSEALIPFLYDGLPRAGSINAVDAYGYRNSRSRTSSTTCSADSTVVTSVCCGAVWISYK